MDRTILLTIAIAALLACFPAAAQGKTAAARAPAAAPCVCPEPAAPQVPRESELAQCGDGLDNDADGHVDCADQDCDIYAMCVAPSAAVTASANATTPTPDPPAGRGG